MQVVKKAILVILAVVLFASGLVAILANAMIGSAMDPAFYLTVARDGGLYDRVRSMVATGFLNQSPELRKDTALRNQLFLAISAALREQWMEEQLKNLLGRAKEYLETGARVRFTLSLAGFKAALKEELGRQFPNLLPRLDLSGIPEEVDVTPYLTGPDGILTQITEPYRIVRRVPVASVVLTGGICLLVLLICLFRPDGFRWASMPLVFAGAVLLIVALVVANSGGYAWQVLKRSLPPESELPEEFANVVRAAISVIGRRTAVYAGLVAAGALGVWVLAGWGKRRGGATGK